MNCFIGKGRLTKDVLYRDNGTTGTSRFTIAIDKYVKGEKSADFINCVAFGKTAEVAERYLQKGSEVLVRGSLSIGSYEKEGQRVNTADIIVQELDFCGSKGEAKPKNDGETDFIAVPDNVEDDSLPFN